MSTALIDCDKHCNPCDDCTKKNHDCNPTNLPVIPNPCGYYGTITPTDVYNNVTYGTTYVGGDGGTVYVGDYGTPDGGPAGIGCGPDQPISVLVCCPLHDEITTYTPCIVWATTVWGIGSGSYGPYPANFLGNIVSQEFAIRDLTTALARITC